MNRFGFALSIAITGGCLVVTLARIGHVSPGDEWYQFGDNLLVICGALCCVLAWRQTQAQPVPRKGSIRISRMFVFGGVSLVIVGAAVVVGLMTAPFPSVDSLMGVPVAVSVSLAAFELADVTRPTTGRVRHPGRAWVVIAAVYLGGVALRALTPGSALLTWVIAPAIAFFVPGLSLGLVLLPESTQWHELLIFAPALSIGSGLISLLWLDFVGLPVSTAALFLIPGAWLAGARLFAFIDGRRRTRSPSPAPPRPTAPPRQ